MRPALDDKHRKHRLATSRAMKTRARKCKSCGRGQNPRKFDAGVGQICWVCRYCACENGSATRDPGSSNGRTSDFESENRGSTPRPGTINLKKTETSDDA